MVPHAPIKTVCFMLLVVALSGNNSTGQTFQPLFDGKALSGWKATPGGTWEAKDGVIVGKSPASEPRHGILLSERQYTDFVVRGEFRVMQGDSGFYFRAERVEGAVGVHGFQVEVDETDETGGLYETGGRAWVTRPTDEAIQARKYQAGEWSELLLYAIGDEIVVEINGVESARLVDQKGRKSGHLGLQLHGGMEMHVEFRDLMICELPGQGAFKNLFNGRDLAGWQTHGNWIVEEDGIVTLHPREGESGWQRYDDYLTTDRKYGDFVLELEFKFEKTGNSGVFMRVGDLQDHVTSGFEVQILDTHGLKKFGPHDCGGVIGTSAPATMEVRPAGEWNRYVIILQGSQLSVLLNGKQIQDFDISKTKLADRPPTGYLSFQDEAKVVSYRNVRIRELK